MDKYELKTRKNNVDVGKFLDSIEDKQRQKDTKAVTKIMEEITGDKPVMWGTSIIGFGSYHYKYASGRENDWMRIGLSPRKQNLTLYILSGLSDKEKMLRQLGKHKTGKGCLYINKLEDVNINVLREMIKQSYNSKAMGEV